MNRIDLTLKKWSLLVHTQNTGNVNYFIEIDMNQNISQFDKNFIINTIRPELQRTITNIIRPQLDITDISFCGNSDKINYNASFNPNKYKQDEPLKLILNMDDITADPNIIVRPQITYNFKIVFQIITGRNLNAYRQINNKFINSS